FRKIITKALTFYIPVKKYRKELRQKLSFLLSSKKERVNYLEIDAKDYTGYAEILNNYNFKTITCHSTRDAIFIKNYLKSQQKQAKLLLMSHSPELPSQERYHVEKQNGNKQAEKIYKIWQQIEQKAFNSADILVFPTTEAMEPYINGADYFNDLIKNKEVQFITTGCEKIDIQSSSVDIRKDYHITTKYIVSFIGRHTEIKGYNKLKEIAEKILNEREDVTFVIGAAQTNEFAPLSHPRWIELGRINPADLLKITDLFILPNKQTYFDLILLEVLSAGVPVLASNTGGNKSVYQATHAIELYDSNEDCISKVNKFLDLADKDKEEKRKLSIQAYENNYTLEHFAKNYDALVKRVANLGEGK
ncbi:MAG: glycosyltransferase family 4 protein, partial [Alphaproteobacteria bacterium]